MTDPVLDQLWIDAARELGVEVVRGGDAYVHYDGKRLFIADDEHLDADDRVAQLVFHELCHGLTQGEHNWNTPDWGLDNTNPEHAWRELACLRLQAALVDTFGLRGVLFPTTPERPYYESLPAHPLEPAAEAPDGSPLAVSPVEIQALRLAQEAAKRAHERPYRPVLVHALTETMRHMKLPLHPVSDVPWHGQQSLTCGTCAWRAENKFCQQVVSATACEDDTRACVRHRQKIDCLRCGACCRSAYDAVYIDPREKIIKTQPDLVGIQGFVYYIRRSGDRCAALSGPPQGPYCCSVYSDRPKTCRDFDNAGRHCLDARRKLGFEGMPPVATSPTD